MQINQSIQDLLTGLRDKQSKIKRQVSAVIAKLDSFLSTDSLLLSPDQCRHLLLGMEHLQLKGLVSYCADRRRFSDSFKKSSVNCIKLINKLLTTNRNRGVFQ